ncbi:type II pantothenate kinase [Paenibacillus sp. MMS20-IR301]|uniref:type II pantothenate kinase n=1 Tax=Paenibacillus sp. MMS20-IR301 TaxID=2895946 RepID=UPI0028E6F74D|nr:type II pantothenate kinase [Paenibacillus sp. MMS20-IR301]WNS46842.1 type II pantothenate kinase [Paenibacillus sp. MMS20-IR301]
MDAGGTLIKIAYIKDGQLELRKFPSVKLTDIAAWISGHFTEVELCVTGGKSDLLQKLLDQKVQQIVEFEATCRGVLHLLQGKEQMPEEHVLTNVGTGTSIHIVTKDEHFRIGGTGVGGGTLLGLSRLLAEVGDYDDIIRLAPQGSREHIDLKVSQIYEGSVPPISGDLTASNFGNLAHDPVNLNPPDYLASVIGLVGETVTTVSVHAAMQHGLSTIVYIGSSFIGNEMLRKVVADYTILRGAVPVLLDNGEYSGAIGALLSIE